MLVGQKLGPFAIDKELGSGAMGTVYRARYVKTGQVVAVKVMAPGLGSTNQHAVDRFEREMELLKRFNHPNIVRLFGVGKSHGTRYYAMEFIEGESLDHVMGRRSRMTWEEVVTLGQQLCAALQHAHEQGVVHRDLKPSNLMMLRDGTLKLTDFGIAKGLDVSRLTSANCAVGTAAYMSPEQCRGDPDLTHKSDLYSLGVLFYELITGHKPFEADNAMEMFMQHVQGTFERPSRRVLDLPVWFDNLICQLLEKKPEHRPLDAATVYAALGKIQEKVEAQRSAGVEAAKMRVIDRQPGTKPPDEADREMARTLLVGKGRARKRKRQRFYEKGWFVAAGALGLLSFLGLLLYLIFAPAPPEKLYERATPLMASADHADHQTALDGPITEYLARYGERPGEQTDQMRRWAEDARVEKCEDLIAHYLQKKGAALKFAAQSATEEAAFKAVDDEADGRLADARRKWLTIRDAHGNDEWGLTAARRLGTLDAVDGQDKAWEQKLKEMQVNGREPNLPPLATEAFRAYRAEHLGEVAGTTAGASVESKDATADWWAAHAIYDEVKQKAKGDSGQRFWFLLAAKKSSALESKVRDKKGDEKDRQRHVAAVVEAARAELGSGKPTSSTDARALALDVVAVYGDAEKYPELAGLVKQASEIIKEANSRQGQ
jgi:serine/threonine-protein kinase